MSCEAFRARNAGRAETALAGLRRAATEGTNLFEQLLEAWGLLVVYGPADEAVAVLGEAVARLPHWPGVHEYLGVAALRAGDCATGEQQLRELAQFGFVRQDAQALLARCRRGER